MTRADIIRMVREVADSEKVDPVCSQGDFITLTPAELERFAALVAAAEREECAMVADRRSTCTNDTPNVIATTIRAKVAK